MSRVKKATTTPPAEVVRVPIPEPPFTAPTPKLCCKFNLSEGGDELWYYDTERHFGPYVWSLRRTGKMTYSLTGLTVVGFLPDMYEKDANIKTHAAGVQVATYCAWNTGVHGKIHQVMAHPVVIRSGLTESDLKVLKITPIRK